MCQFIKVVVHGISENLYLQSQIITETYTIHAGRSQMWQCIQLLFKYFAKKPLKMSILWWCKRKNMWSPRSRGFCPPSSSCWVFQSGQMPKNVCLLMFMFSVSQALFSFQTEQQQWPWPQESAKVTFLPLKWFNILH